jgi:hypothetical protein
LSGVVVLGVLAQHCSGLLLVFALFWATCRLDRVACNMPLSRDGLIEDGLVMPAVGGLSIRADAD